MMVGTVVGVWQAFKVIFKDGIAVAIISLVKPMRLT